MKKYTYVSVDIETCKTYDGDNIIFDRSVITNWVKQVFTNEILNLSEEKKSEFFQMQHEYVDVLNEMWSEALFDVSDLSSTKLFEVRNPTKEYKPIMSVIKDEYYIDEAHLKKEILTTQYKDWYEKQIK